MIKIIKKRSFLLTLVILLSGAFTVLHAQMYDSVLKVLDTKYPQEKLYLHFDRSYYNPGETIWFKAYLFAANLPSQISKTVYADLIDEKGKVIDRKISPVVMSSAAAAFDLPATLTSSTVYIRAYTDWMMNFDSSFLFIKAIPVLQEKKTSSKTVVPRNFLQFFPEGGELVDGVESRVAFKATDIHGLPYNVSGEVVDSKGKPVTKFSAIHDGMGYIMLTPVVGEQFKAIWKDAAGKNQQTNLPAVKKDGFVMRIDQDASSVRFAISRPEKEVSPNTSVYVVGQMQQQLVYMATANISKNKTIHGTIPTENIPAGIIQLTVFSQDNKPQAERIVFVNKQDYYFITDLNSPLKGFDKRRKNVIQIDVPDTIRTNLSVSVTDAGINPKLDGEDDIFSNVLLTSDIKGYIHNPAYYFSSDADSVLSHLDLVMMTNGWRRFKWEDALAGKFPKITHMPSDYLTINGKINGLTRTELTQKELTGIMVINKKQEFLQIPVEQNGTFSLQGMIFFDTAKLYYQFNNDKERVLTSKATFDVKSNLMKPTGSVKTDSSAAYHSVLPPQDVWAKNMNLAEKNIAVLDARRKVQMLAAVTVTAKQKTKKEQMDEEYTSGLFSKGDAYTFILDDDISARGSLSVLNYLQGKVAGLQINVVGDQASLSWRGGTPSLFVNEMQSEVQTVQSLQMNDVALIKVFRPPFFGAQGGGTGGAIAVYTKKGAALNSDVKGLDFANIPGYSPEKEFYSPDYSKYDERNSEADYRPTLYWNPFVLTDKNSRRILYTFYNNDVTHRFRVVVEGCDEQGRLTRIEKIFE
jgi:hypothetical protein